MSTRSRVVFITREEFTDIMAEVMEKFSLAGILWFPNKCFEYWDQTVEGLSTARSLFLSENEHSLEELDPKRPSPGKLGWVQMDIPRIINGNLLRCQFGAKSDWYDLEKEALLEDKTSIELFNKIWRFIRRKFKNPVAINNIAYEVSNTYRDLYYSQGAETWYKNGGGLRQEGLDNLIYEIPD